MTNLEKTFKKNVVFEVYIKTNGKWRKEHVGTFNSLNEADMGLGKWFGLNYGQKPCSMSVYEGKKLGDLNAQKIKIKDNIISFEVDNSRSSFTGHSDDVGKHYKDSYKIWVIAELLD